MAGGDPHQTQGGGLRDIDGRLEEEVAGRPVFERAVDQAAGEGAGHLAATVPGTALAHLGQAFSMLLTVVLVS